jgi:outer membrane protein assembly factor BamB
MMKFDSWSFTEICSLKFEVLRLCVLLLLALPFRSRAYNDPTNDWSLDVRADIDCCPAIAADGTIYFGTWSGMFCAVNPNGSLKWKFTSGYGGVLGCEIISSPAIGKDGTIYFGCRDRKFYALRPDGHKKWQFQTGGWVDSSPAVAADGTVCFGSWDKTFYALTPEGAKKWQFQTAGEIVSSPAIGLDGTVYFGSHDKTFYALNPDGRQKWRFDTAAQIISSPALSRDAVFFTSVDGWCYRVNLDGSLRWRLRTGGITQSSPVLAPDGTLYVGVNNCLWAISEKGEKKWVREHNSILEAAAPFVLADDSACYIGRGGELINAAASSELKWAMGLGPYRYGCPAVGPTGIIYAPHYGGLVALRTHFPLAKSPWPKFRGNPRNTGCLTDCPAQSER